MSPSKFSIAVSIAFLLTLILSASEISEQVIQNAIVKITVTSKTSNYFEPWLMRPQRTASGSGCIIDGKRILTNAHIVADQVFIQVQRNGDPIKYTAEVEFAGHDCDLAVLKTADPAFFQGTQPLSIGGIPSLRSNVTVYGFPQGGEKMSVTAGVVSRIEIGEYIHSGLSYLRLQIDAAINPGNSGGAVMSQDKLVGIAFSASRDSENIGYAVPKTVIEHFLADIADGRYDGLPDLGVTTQKIESPTLREALKVDAKCSGIRISEIAFGSGARGILQPDDVLLAIAGSPVACDGTVQENEIGEVEFTHLIHKFQIGETISLSLLRNGQKTETRVKLGEFCSLVPKDRYDVRPTYFIMAGLVFQPLTADYLYCFNDYSDIPAELLNLMKNGKQSEHQKEAVLLSKVLPHSVNIGYHDIGNQLLVKMNDRRIGSMMELIAACDSPPGKFHVMVLADGSKIVLDAAASKRALPEILKRFQVTSDRSEDLK